MLEISSFYKCVPKITIMYGSWDTEWNRQYFLSFWVIFCPFNIPPNNTENINFKKKKMKKTPGDIILSHIYVHHKWRSYDTWFLKYKLQQTEVFVILGNFLPFQPNGKLENQNFEIEKNTSRCYHSTYLHHKWQLYDVWFLRYGVQQTECFVILDRFLPFYPLWLQKTKIFKIWKKHRNTLSFYKCVS